MDIWLGPRRVSNLSRRLERDDIYFSNPWPWGWKMHVSGSAKAAQIIIYASVSSPSMCSTSLAGCLASDAWCLTPWLSGPCLLYSLQDDGVVLSLLWKAPVKCKPWPGVGSPFSTFSLSQMPLNLLWSLLVGLWCANYFWWRVWIMLWPAGQN